MVRKYHNHKPQTTPWHRSTCEKSNKNNLRIISKPYAYFQSMTKPQVKFQKNWYKTVGGVAPTRYPLAIYIAIDNAQKMAKLNLRKKRKKNNLRIISKPHAYLQTITKTPVRFQKNLYNTVGGVAPTRYLLL